jgi:RNA polymerase sigma-70 factor (ECF subfamily)
MPGVREFEVVNRYRIGGVLLHDVTNGHAATAVGRFLSVDDTVEREFEALLIESSTLAFRVAYSVLRHRQDAEDVAQEAFARAHRGFSRLRARDRFRSWLIRMTWRLALDKRRSDRRRTARETEHGRLAGESHVWEPGRPDRAVELWQAIDALPEKLRLVVVLAHVEGHQISEVAALLHVPEGTVKSRLFLARQRLKAQLS